MASQAKPEGEGTPGARTVQVPLVWGATEAIRPDFADQLAVSKVTNEYYHLTFGQVQLPVITEPVKGLATIRPLTTLVVTRDVLESFVRVLKSTLET